MERLHFVTYFLLKKLVNNKIKNLYYFSVTLFMANSVVQRRLNSASALQGMRSKPARADKKRYKKFFIMNFIVEQKLYNLKRQWFYLKYDIFFSTMIV